MSESFVEFHFQDIDKFALNERLICDWIKGAIRNENKKLGELNCIFCSDSFLHEMNQTYLDHDTYTDIITFNYVEENLISGDLYISIDRVFENASTFNVSKMQELNRVIIHGVLHLIGYNDKTPEEADEIRAKEDFYLTLLVD